MSSAGAASFERTGQRAIRREPVMGTVFSFDVRNIPAGAALEDALAEAIGRLHWVDDVFSTYSDSSEVNRFDRGELPVGRCSPELRHVITLCHRYAQLTGGYFDAWAGGRFDPSGVVKGWAAQEASLLLARRGFIDHAVDGGGDIVLSGSPADGQSWKVGVRHPLVSGAYSAALSLGPSAVATSGTYERGQHVVNPFTRRPAAELVSVTVVGPDMVDADAYATAALAMGRDAPGWLSSLDGYESQVVSAEGRGWSTPGYKALTGDR